MKGGETALVLAGGVSLGVGLLFYLRKRSEAQAKAHPETIIVKTLPSLESIHIVQPILGVKVPEPKPSIYETKPLSETGLKPRLEVPPTYLPVEPVANITYNEAGLPVFAGWASPPMGYGAFETLEEYR